MNFEIRPYSSASDTIWDEFCKGNTNATFLHTRKFLRYHEQRFIDYSLTIHSDDVLVGVFPIAVSKSNLDLPISHPGISYGGIVHSGKLLGEDMVNILKISTEYLSDLGFRKLIYKPVPSIYNTFPAQDDLYALFRNGAYLSRCDLSSTINLQERRRIKAKRIKTKIDSNYVLKSDNGFEHIIPFWILLEENLMNKYETTPTHSISEIIELKKLFNDNIEFFTIFFQSEFLAGVVVFTTKRTWHIQYMAASDSGRKFSALDILIERIISLATERSVSFLDFGHSNLNQGKYLNQGLYGFKSKFGGGGIAINEFTLDIS